MADSFFAAFVRDFQAQIKLEFTEGIGWSLRISEEDGSNWLRRQATSNFRYRIIRDGMKSTPWRICDDWLRKLPLGVEFEDGPMEFELQFGLFAKLVHVRKTFNRSKPEITSLSLMKGGQGYEAVETGDGVWTIPGSLSAGDYDFQCNLSPSVKSIQRIQEERTVTIGVDERGNGRGKLRLMNASLLRHQENEFKFKLLPEAGPSQVIKLVVAVHGQATIEEILQKPIGELNHILRSKLLSVEGVERILDGLWQPIAIELMESWRNTIACHDREEFISLCLEALKGTSSGKRVLQLTSDLILKFVSEEVHFEFPSPSVASWRPPKGQSIEWMEREAVSYNLGCLEDLRDWIYLQEVLLSISGQLSSSSRGVKWSGNASKDNPWPKQLLLQIGGTFQYPMIRFDGPSSKIYVGNRGLTFDDIQGWNNEGVIFIRQLSGISRDRYDQVLDHLTAKDLAETLGARLAKSADFELIRNQGANKSLEMHPANVYLEWLDDIERGHGQIYDHDAGRRVSGPRSSFKWIPKTWRPVIEVKSEVFMDKGEE
ncbi:MAG: hypothetical protein DWQ01_01230 [Planctomycetota bacterium]|nr:MAG: hypothetical protein DWQ01_01230 [Planctomycetota bacterium]